MSVERNIVFIFSCFAFMLSLRAQNADASIDGHMWRQWSFEERSAYVQGYFDAEGDMEFNMFFDVFPDEEVKNVELYNQAVEITKNRADNLSTWRWINGIDILYQKRTKFNDVKTGFVMQLVWLIYEHDLSLDDAVGAMQELCTLNMFDTESIPVDVYGDRKTLDHLKRQVGGDGGELDYAKREVLIVIALVTTFIGYCIPILIIRWIFRRRKKRAERGAYSDYTVIEGVIFVFCILRIGSSLMSDLAAIRDILSPYIDKIGG